MDYRSKLFYYPRLYDQKGSDPIFLEAIKGSLRHHYRHCPEYRKILRAEGMKAEDLKTIEDLWRIPPIPTAFFKKHSLYSMKPEKAVVRVTSSGTGGLKSRMGFDLKSLWYGMWMAIRTGRSHGLFSPVPTNYVLMGYEPTGENRTIIVKTQAASTLYAPALHRSYALTYQGGEYRLNFSGVARALSRYAKLPFPVRIIGFPAYTWFFLRKLRQSGFSARLPAGSRLFLGGGWKQFYKEKVDKRQLYDLAWEVLGIGEEQCREFFGAAEHPSIYCDCKNHHFHVPVFSRVIIRDVNTLRPLGFGKPGIVNLITPIAGSMPLVSVLTDDLGILHEGSRCGCGIGAPYFEIIGRAGMEEIKTCAAGADEILHSGEKSGV